MDPESRIKDATSKSGKTYGFAETHDPKKPSQMWFQESFDGLVLFIVFHTQACQWSRCTGCNLPSLCSAEHISFDHIMDQVDFIMAQEEVQAKRDKIRKVIVSNNGSVLDEETFSSTALIYLVAQINRNFPNLSILSLETRVNYVDLPELEFLARAIAEGETPTKLELAVGFEAFDDDIRNKRFKKGLALKDFEELVEKVSRYGFSLKVYFMQKPVEGMNDEDAVKDIKQALDYLDELAHKSNVQMNIHLNPTFVAKGTLLEKAFRRKRFTPPSLLDVARAALHAETKKPTVYIGLNDEGMAVEGGSFRKPGDDGIVEQLEEFNRTQDYSILRRILGKS